MKRNITIALVIFIGLWIGCVPQDAYTQDTQSLPELAREYYDRGVSYGKQGKYAEAVTELEKAIDLYPAYADAYNALGVIYYHQKQHQQAIEQYLLAIEADPTHTKARTNLAMMYNEQQEYRKAVRQLEKALAIAPNYAPARNLIDVARKKAEEQDKRELERQQKEAKRLSQPPSAPSSKNRQQPKQSVFNAGTNLIKQGKIEAGIQEYKRVLKAYPRSAEGYTLLGMAYREKYRVTHEMKWRQEEILAFNKALKYNPKHVSALLGLGETLYEQGELSRAISYFQKVLRYAPNHPAKDQLEVIVGQPQ